MKTKRVFMVRKQGYKETGSLKEEFCGAALTVEQVNLIKLRHSKQVLSDGWLCAWFIVDTEVVIEA